MHETKNAEVSSVVPERRAVVVYDRCAWLKISQRGTVVHSRDLAVTRDRLLHPRIRRVTLIRGDLHGNIRVDSWGGMRWNFQTGGFRTDGNTKERDFINPYETIFLRTSSLVLAYPCS